MNELRKRGKEGKERGREGRRTSGSSKRKRLKRLATTWGSEREGLVCVMCMCTWMYVFIT